MSNILLTGATGYLGSHLSHALLASGHEVAILKRSNSNMDRISDIVSQLDVYDIDIDGLQAPFEASKHINVVVHTATCYGRNDETQLKVFKANTQFPHELLEIATFFKTETFLNTTTILNEHMNAYALSKNQFSQWGKRYADLGKIQFINIRLDHFFGPGDDASKFTTWIIRQCLANVPKISLTKGEQERDFIYINDIVSAYLLLIEKNIPQKKWLEIGIGSGKPIKIKEFVKAVHQITHSASDLAFGMLPYRNNEVMKYTMDVSFMRDIGWEIKCDLISGLKKTVAKELNK